MAVACSVKPFSDARPDVLLYSLRHGQLEASITNLGATVTRLLLPDSSGVVADVVLGFDDGQPYLEGEGLYFGCVVGRVANRVANASFTIDGHRYQVSANEGSTSLHGGKVGFDKAVWQSRQVASEAGPSVCFTHCSPDGDQGYPGEVEVRVTYTLEAAQLRTHMEARPRGNIPTPISLAHHTYWNLGGHDSGDILGHRLRLWASRYTPVDSLSLPTGEILPVEGTPFDFRKETLIGSRIADVPGEPGGYDHNYVLDGKGGDGGEGGGEGDGGGAGEGESGCGTGLRVAARLMHPGSGRVMELHTSAPAVQFYTGNYLSSTVGKGGAEYGKHAALCLETQAFPNAVNEPNFPSITVRPGETYTHVMIHRFSTAAESES